MHTHTEIHYTAPGYGADVFTINTDCRIPLAAVESMARVRTRPGHSSVIECRGAKHREDFWLAWTTANGGRPLHAYAYPR